MAGRFPTDSEDDNDEYQDMMNMIQDIKVSARDGTRYSLREDRPRFMNNNPLLFTDQDRRNMAKNVVRHSADEKRENVRNKFSDRMRDLKNLLKKQETIESSRLPDEVKANIKSFTGSIIPRRREDDIIEPFNPAEIYNQDFELDPTGY